uniref:Uncharacterized protein n=1 Tax=Varanus komodoensis TaxID=61221 RepID=A0A8D2JAA3_VARKO
TALSTIDQINDALSRLESKEMFQTPWDIAAFAIFFTFIGKLWRRRKKACFCCCCDCNSSPSYEKVSV